MVADLNGDKSDDLPRHVAIIMDGNGRWAKQRGLPRISGHEAGVEALQKIVDFIARYRHGIKALTVYTFSSENWKRPQAEISMLTELFDTTLAAQFEHLHNNNIRLRFIGDTSALPEKLQRSILDAEMLMVGNTGLQLVVAINYGGRWDITNALAQICERVKRGELRVTNINEALINKYISLSDLPDPDLLIRTGGEMRISNYLLWQLAYTELYFDDCLWPDFDSVGFDKSLQWYARRERRFGRISEQLVDA